MVSANLVHTFHVQESPYDSPLVLGRAGHMGDVGDDVSLVVVRIKESRQFSAKGLVKSLRSEDQCAGGTSRRVGHHFPCKFAVVCDS